MRVFLALVVCMAFCLPAVQTAGASEFQVNTFTTDSQYFPRIGQDASGNFIIVWPSLGQDGSEDGIFGQRFDSLGVTQGSEFQANSYTTLYQYLPVVAMDDSGDFVVVWTSYLQDGSYGGIFGQRYDDMGIPAGNEFQINTFTNNSQCFPSVAMNGMGNFVVAWNGAGQGDSYGVFGRLFDSAGIAQGNEFKIPQANAQQSRPSVDIDDAGNFVVVWQSYAQDGSNYGVFGRRFDSTGSPDGGEIDVNTFTTGDQSNPVVSMDGSGNFVVIWQGLFQDGSDYGIFGQRYDSTGSPTGGEFQINGFTLGYQKHPAVDLDDSGEFIVTWASLGQDGGGAGIFARHFNATATPSGAEFQVNSYTQGHQGFPVVAMDGSGDFVIAWDSPLQDGSNYGVFAKLFAGVPCIAAPASAVENLAVDLVNAGADLMMTWNNTGDAAEYVLFADTDPNGAFTSTVGTADSGVTGLLTPVPPGNVFYLVAGRNPCGLGAKR